MNSFRQAQRKLESKDSNRTWGLGEKKGFRREIGVGSGHRWPAHSIRIGLCPNPDCAVMIKYGPWIQRNLDPLMWIKLRMYPSWSPALLPLFVFLFLFSAIQSNKCITCLHRKKRKRKVNYFLPFNYSDKKDLSDIS